MLKPKQTITHGINSIPSDWPWNCHCISLSSTSSDYKNNLVKLCKASVERERVHLRKIRQSCMVALRKEKDTISQDLNRQIEKQVGDSAA